MAGTMCSEDKSRPEIFREAISATGGPQSDAIGAIRNYIDLHYAGFTWAPNWYAEVAGAKAAERHRLRLPDALRTSTHGDESAASPSQPPVAAVTLQDLCAAREFVNQVGQGSLEQARCALSHLGQLSPATLLKLPAAVAVWSDLLNAVDGNPETAAKVLKVFAPAATLGTFPRLATADVQREAA